MNQNKVPEMDHRTSESEIGIIMSLQDSDAIVELSIGETCASCGARMLCVPDGTGKRRLRASNPLNAKIGSKVTIIEKSNFLLKVSFLQYGLPLIFFFIFIFSFYFANISILSIPDELIWFSGGLTGLIIGAIISRYFIERLVEKGECFFEIVAIVH